MNTRYEEGFAKNVNKAMKTKENVKTLKEKRLSETVEGLQEKHKRKQEKIKIQQDEERRQFIDRIHGMHEKI
jgi:3-dehydroquinate dehydratase